MNRKDTNPAANNPAQDADEPFGDRGSGDRTWSPGPGEQGISNRPDDEEDRETSADEDDDFEEDEDDEEELQEDEDENV
jgi:hypothetical protein